MHEVPLADRAEIRPDANVTPSTEQKLSAYRAETKQSVWQHPLFRLAVSAVVFLIGVAVIMISAYLRGPGALTGFWDSSFAELGLALCITGVSYFVFQQIVDHANNEQVDEIIGKAVSGVSTKISEIDKSLELLLEQNDILSGAFESDIVCIHQNRGKAAEDILNAMQSSKEIKVMGVSLRDYFTPGGKQHAQINKLLEDVLSSRDRNFQALLLNPYSDQAKIRAERESLSKFDIAHPYQKSGLYSEVKQSIRYLLALCDEWKVRGRLYKSAPTCFLVITDSFTFLEQYHYGLPQSGLKGGRVPVLKFPSTSPVAKQLGGHFEYVWDHHSIEFHDTEVAMMVGVPKNAAECQLVNLFPTRADAARRIEYLFEYESDQAVVPRAPEAKDASAAVASQVGGGDIIGGGKPPGGLEPDPCEAPIDEDEHRVVRLIGISLRDFFKGGRFYTLMKTRFKDKPIVVQALLLDPHSEQGVLRSEREDPGSEPSSLYFDVIASLNNIERLNKNGTKVQARLYRGAPSCFVVLTKDSAIVEQYHYGSEDPGDTILGGRVPVLEFHNQSSMYSALFEHFRYMWAGEQMSKCVCQWLREHQQDGKTKEAGGEKS